MWIPLINNIFEKNEIEGHISSSEEEFYMNTETIRMQEKRKLHDGI
jgi:hypothetical protein